ncbi:MAG: hypothetical protein NZ898_13785 [Myxococcota bacterium]|nr:hypothetical protein [Myxococcota bacterium]MDW8362906.1 hypothetical protein [Myxococcales bacterium]
MKLGRSRRGASVLWGGLFLLSVGCEEPARVGAPATGSAPGTGTAPQPAPASGTPTSSPGAAPGTNPTGAGADPAAAVQPGQAAEPAGAVLEYRDDDFVEAETNRDPFRSFAALFKVRPVAVPQRAVIMPSTAIDEMRLIAVITGVEQPRAMLVDTNGVGHVVRRGDFIGRPELVQAGGPEGATTTLNWRVDRIRPTGLLLTREDPSAPNRPPLTRFVPLDPDADRNAEFPRGS